MYVMMHCNMYKFRANWLWTVVFILKIHANNALTKKTPSFEDDVRTSEISANSSIVNMIAIAHFIEDS